MDATPIAYASSTQTTIALSSGEAELGNLPKMATHGTGLKSIADEFGIDFNIAPNSDATAAISMSRGTGSGA